MNQPSFLPQRPVPPRTDLRDMLRQYLARRSLDAMAAAASRRAEALCGGTLAPYQAAVRRAVRAFYGDLPAGPAAPPPTATLVSAFDHDGFRVENVLFESFPGWQVNATVFVPRTTPPPWPAVVVPVGHSGKQFDNYQLPGQWFARCGFLAVTFDPPGQAGEKQPGNDHFHDGVRDYLLGETSSRYFVADALRCIDYLATRPDADLARGVAMTGVSGGGTTTTLAALLDPRITVIGPSCCVTPLADLDITQCYAGCPETHMWRRYADGVDEVDLLAAAAPTPCLLMAGREDEVFKIADTQRLADQVAGVYGALSMAGQFRFFVDSAGHGYSLRQARAFTEFMNQWLRPAGAPAPALPDEAAVRSLPEAELKCRPRPEANMRTLAAAQAGCLAAAWDLRPERVRVAAAQLCGVAGTVPVPAAETGTPFRVWTHDWVSVMLRPEPDIELPATWLPVRDAVGAPVILHFDDAGRHRLLQRQGVLLKAAGFLREPAGTHHLLTVDLRGWGDTAPAVYPYELAGWGGVDRYLAYTSAALGDSVMTMRIRDGLATLAWLRTQPQARDARVVVTGCGLGAVVALHVAVLAQPAVAGAVVWDGLASFRDLAGAEPYAWPADAFFPGVLRHYDLPELAAAVPGRVTALSLRTPQGTPLAADACRAWCRADTVAARPEHDDAAIAAAITSVSGWK